MTLILESEKFYMIKRFMLLVVSFLLMLFSTSGCCFRNDIPAKHEEKIPLLVYHHFVETESQVATPATVTIGKFYNDLQYLEQHGYHSISYEELIAHYESGYKLPPKPFLLRFDDGYLSNYELAFPVMKEFGAKATICIVGISVGVTKNIIPHFNWSQAREMVDSGLVSIQSHTYNLHKSKPRGVARLEGESLQDYKARLREDFTMMNKLIEDNLGYAPYMLAYPNAVCNEYSEEIAFECGYTYTTAPKGSVAHTSREKYNITRYTIYNDTQLEDILVK